MSAPKLRHAILSVIAGCTAKAAGLSLAASNVTVDQVLFVYRDTSPGREVSVQCTLIKDHACAATLQGDRRALHRQKSIVHANDVRSDAVKLARAIRFVHLTWRRRSATPTRPKPASIMPYVAGSGTAEMVSV